MSSKSYLISLIQLDSNDAKPLYLQIYECLRRAISEGQLTPGLKLPSSRDLADLLRVSRNTITNALDQLIAEGYLETREKSGTFVTSEIPEGMFRSIPADVVTPARSALPTLSAQGTLLASAKPHQTRSGNKHNIFTNGIPDLEQFPFDIWARLTAKHYRYAPLSVFDETIPAAGYLPLREAIAGHLRVARSVNCTAEQVIVVSGSQQGFYLAARMLLDPGDPVWMEEPGCMGPNAAFMSQGARLVPVPVDDEGMDIEQAAAIAPTARVAYINPSHHYPLGVTMSLSRRYQLLQHAAQRGMWIVEDDYDSEFRYSGRPLASVQGLDKADTVIYIGTFSKSLFPGLRLGYMVVPARLAAAFAAGRAVIDKYPHIINQMVLADFITEGHFHRHLRRMRKLYDDKRRVLLDAITTELGGLIELGPSDTGMHVCGYLPDDISDRQVAAAGAKLGIEILPLSEFYIGSQPRNGLILGYTAIPIERIADGVRQLRQVIGGAVNC